MAQNYKYEKTLTSKFSIKGLLSEDGETVTYVDADKEEKQISLKDCFKPFRGEAFNLTIGTKETDDLSDEFEKEDEE